MYVEIGLVCWSVLYIVTLSWLHIYVHCLFIKYLFVIIVYCANNVYKMKISTGHHSRTMLYVLMQMSYKLHNQHYLA